MSKLKRAVDGDGVSRERFEVAQRLILQEAEALDAQRWSDWLALYRQDAILWLPAWVDEHRITSNIDEEISHIYHAGLDEIRERVIRITSKKSATALPLPRTSHVIGAPLIVAEAENEITARSNATVHVFDVRTAKHHLMASRYEHVMARDGDGQWLIQKKKIVLVNDFMPSVVDIYSV